METYGETRRRWAAFAEWVGGSLCFGNATLRTSENLTAFSLGFERVSLTWDTRDF
jgi:hypothetical protein